MGKIHNFDKINWKPFQVRFQNIEVKNFYIDDNGVSQPLQSHLTDTFNFFEILKVQRNPYYGKESEYEWADENQAYSKESRNAFIHKSCFKRPETSYMLASWVNLNHDECTPDLKFVGDRPLHLSEEEKRNFWYCVKIGQEHIQHVLRNFENE